MAKTEASAGEPCAGVGAKTLYCQIKFLMDFT